MLFVWHKRSIALPHVCELHGAILKLRAIFGRRVWIGCTLACRVNTCVVETCTTTDFWDAICCRKDGPCLRRHGLSPTTAVLRKIAALGWYSRVLVRALCSSGKVTNRHKPATRVTPTRSLSHAHPSLGRNNTFWNATFSRRVCVEETANLYTHVLTCAFVRKLGTVWIFRVERDTFLNLATWSLQKHDCSLGHRCDGRETRVLCKIQSCFKWCLVCSCDTFILDTQSHVSNTQCFEPCRRFVIRTTMKDRLGDQKIFVVSCWIIRRDVWKRV